MFTGLVEEIGIVQSVLRGAKSARIVIRANRILGDVKLGDSINTNGVCLTVTDFKDNSFSVDVMAETMRKSNLKGLYPGSRVNMERALRLGDRLGGHLLSGHIDGTGSISSFNKEENAVWVTIKASPELLKYIIPRGSIAIDGISLTAAHVDEEAFKVSIIPHTKDVTTLLEKAVGNEVNLECDMVGKYIERLMNYNSQNVLKSSINMEFLRSHGFY